MSTEASEPARVRDGAAREGGDGAVTKLSPWSPADTLTRLAAVLTARGMKVFAEIDFSGEARDAGFELRDMKLVFFGNPRTGAPVVAAAPLAALDLPLRVLVWADGHQTKISYTDPAVLAARHGLIDELADALTGIESVTSAVINR